MVSEQDLFNKTINLVADRIDRDILESILVESEDWDNPALTLEKLLHIDAILKRTYPSLYRSK